MRGVRGDREWAHCPQHHAKATYCDRCVDELMQAVRDDFQDTLAEQAREIESMRIAQQRADGALADAGTVPTGNLERGIRMLTAERDVLQAALAGQVREIERLKRAIGHAAHRNHISDGCDGCRDVDAALRATPEAGW